VHWRNIGSFLLAFGRCFRRQPRTTGCATWRLIMRGPSRKRFKRFFRAINLADRMHRDRVAHMHAAWAHTPASVGVLASKINGTPWSMSGHAKDIYLANPDSLKRNLHHARYTTTCTKTNVSFLREKGIREDASLPEPAIELFYHGVDCGYYSCDEHNASAPEANGTPSVLSVGRLVPKKGYDVLIEAVSMLHRRGLSMRLDIIGDGPLRADLERKIRERELDEVVR